MHIDTGSFFALVGTLAAGGVGGYTVAQKHLFDGSPSSQDLAPAISASVAPPSRPPSPPCDDTVGAAGACPTPGYSSDEGGCDGLPAKRCNDFKQAMKPRVAERAVACMNALTPGERCDPNRLNLCGHLALMSACPEPGNSDGDNGDGSTDAVTALCQTVIHECAAAPLGPTLRDCRATLAGLSELGRSKMVACLSTHCTDKSLLHCEAVVDVK